MRAEALQARPGVRRRVDEAVRARTVEGAMPRFDDCFAELRDPRGLNARRHDLWEILMIAACAVLSGGQTAVDMAVFAEAKQEFLGNFLQLKNGVPSHDTFSRVFRQLDPDQFRACFQRFMTRFSETSTGVIAIDGKVLRRPIDPAPPWVRAAHDQRLVLRYPVGPCSDRHDRQNQREHSCRRAVGDAGVAGQDRHHRRAELPT